MHYIIMVFYFYTKLGFRSQTHKLPVVDRIRTRLYIGRFCVVVDRGMTSDETMKELNQRKIPYILGARIRKVKEIWEEVLSRAGRYAEVHHDGRSSKDPAPLKVKEIRTDSHRYILCLNVKQARKEALDRQAIVDALKEQLKKNPKTLIGNKGYWKYLKLDRDHLYLD
jgi:transposase